MCTEVDCLFVKTQSTCLGTWVAWLLYLCNHLPWANYQHAYLQRRVMHWVVWGCLLSPSLLIALL